MGVVPEARGRGFGYRMLASAVQDAKNRRDRRMVLEVIEKNVLAIKLYSKLGFSSIRRLVDDAFALTTEGPDENVKLLSIVVPKRYRLQGWGSRLVRELLTAFPGCTLTISPIVPEDLAPEFFRKLGFELLDLSQLEMRIDLSSADDNRLLAQQ